VKKFKEIFLMSLKIGIGILLSLTLILFIYAAFFYEDDIIKKETVENEISQSNEIEEEVTENTTQQDEEVTDNSIQQDEEVAEVPKIAEEIRDGLFVVVGNQAVTKLDVVNEIKVILILNNISYSDEKRQELQEMAIKAIVKRTVKEIELKKYGFLEYSKTDFNNELYRLAERIDMDVETLKKICAANNLDFKIIEQQIKSELLWNSLMFHLYKNRLSINSNEIEDQLKLNQNKKDISEFLISEIVIKSVPQEEFESKVNEIKGKIEIDGFESTAMNESISQTAINGGDLGWLNENEISKKFKSKIFNTPIGGISEPVILQEGILIFKVRDRREKKNEMNLEELKNKLVNAEKSKILNMYAISHYDNLRRSMTVKFFNE
jgi:parvulin-like peptidyl-prolyl isomerase